METAVRVTGADREPNQVTATAPIPSNPSAAGSKPSHTGDFANGATLPASAGKCRTRGIASVAALCVGLPLAGAAVAMSEIIQQGEYWNPLKSEAVFFLFCLVGTGLAAAASMMRGMTALKQTQRAEGRLRGHFGALAAKWYWQCLLLALVGILLVGKLAGLTADVKTLLVRGVVTDAVTGKPITNALVAPRLTLTGTSRGVCLHDSHTVTILSMCRDYTQLMRLAGTPRQHEGSGFRRHQEKLGETLKHGPSSIWLRRHPATRTCG